MSLGTGLGWWLLPLVLVLAYALLVLVGHWRWQGATRSLQARLDALGRVPAPPHQLSAVVHLVQIEGLPQPVQRYLRLVLREGQPVPHGARLRQEGTFNMKADGDGWKPFSAVQQVLLQQPAFVWDARIALAPGLDVHVHDAYVGGQGLLHAAVLGAVPMAQLSGGGQLAQGELMRWLAEAPWYPTALLPSQGVQWAAVDKHSADATLSDGDVKVSLRFHFGSDGLVDTVTAVARGRLVGGISQPTPWQGRFWNYALRHDLRVPLQGEVAWLLPGGASPYWRGRVSSIDFESMASAAAPATRSPGLSHPPQPAKAAP